MQRIVLVLALMLAAVQARAVDLTAPFESIDGGTLSLSDWRGQPVLVVNTASQCAFTGQYRGLQTLYDTYRAQGLVVLAVPSDDFRQELASNQEVKAFCELEYGIDMPMTGITQVTGDKAHPFYASVKDEVGFVPAWNFNKVLIGPDGKVAATYGSGTRPTSARLRKDVERLLR